MRTLRQDKSVLPPAGFQGLPPCDRGDEREEEERLGAALKEGRMDEERARPGLLLAVAAAAALAEASAKLDDRARGKKGLSIVMAAAAVAESDTGGGEGDAVAETGRRLGEERTKVPRRPFIL
jgi:hypothetical protein